MGVKANETRRFLGERDDSGDEGAGWKKNRAMEGETAYQGVTCHVTE